MVAIFLVAMKTGSTASYVPSKYNFARKFKSPKVAISQLTEVAALCSAFPEWNVAADVWEIAKVDAYRK